jgi:1-acyl-sn-glycerol-3-phosphate acyltransferase
MLTLDVMKRIQLTTRPKGQMLAGWILRANYTLPQTRTRIRIENFDRMPSADKPVYIAMNHTDKFNYWPLQVQLWRERNEFTATWAKGKYYNHGFSRGFLTSTNNIPTPSRGYLITTDAVSVLNKPPCDELYRLLRHATQEGWDDSRLLEDAKAAGLERDMLDLLKTPRNILGLDFDPFKHSLVERHRELFRQMMDLFVDLNTQAFELGLRVVVFPEGTRSITLGTGKPGLAQMALRTQSTILPIGSNGCEGAYPGNNPFSRGGSVLYRIGEPLTPQKELAPYRIDAPYRPFTDEANQYSDKFDAVTDLVMKRIADLVDPHYLAGTSSAVEGTERFV